MAKKPAYFVDLVQRMQFEIPADKVPRSFGRSPICEIKTLSPEDVSNNYSNDERGLARSVSREQGKILHTKDGRIILIPLRGKSPMWIGTEGNPRKTLVIKDELIAYGSYVTIGNGYQFVLRQYRDEEPTLAKVISGRVQDTSSLDIKLEGLI